MRISFAGGGTDLPAYYMRHQGMVVSAAIDKYTYVFISPNGSGGLQLSSSDYSTFVRHSGGEEVAEAGKLSYARAFMRRFGIRAGYSVFMASEMPPGTGLGSSSSLAVALAKALAAIQDDLPEKAAVAEIAAQVEIDHLHMPIGRQDHYTAAHGGINAITFSAGGVAVEPLTINEATRAWLMDSLMLFFTEQSHESREILSEQSRRSQEDDEAIVALHEIRDHAEEVREAFLSDEPQRLGEIMHRTWLAKKRLAPGITNDHIDAAYEAANAAGATGGKIAGAGGGGFLLLVCPSGRQGDVSKEMGKLGLTRSDFHFDSSGARILVNNAAN
jgi:D-glycero-alpha-D-manno-heptose-7-phosphate kinase